MNRYAQSAITVADVRLEYLEIQPCQPSTKAPLLLLHGLLATAETLTGLMLNLPRDRRIVALDLLSAEPDGPSGEGDVRSASLAELIGRFMHSIGLHRPVLIGHSYGGTLALWLAATCPGRIRGLVLLCPAHPFQGYSSRTIAFYLSRGGRLLALSIPLAPRWLVRGVCNRTTGAAEPLSAAQFKPYLRVLRNRGMLRRVLRMLRSWESDMSSLRQALLASPPAQPALLIWGDRDPVVPLFSAAALQEWLPQSERVILHGRGHLLSDEVPIECGSLISGWLDRLDSGKPACWSPFPQAGLSPNSSDTQLLIAATSTPSFEAGD